jgi:hypothetical protein
VPHGGDDGKGSDTWHTDYFDTDVRDWMYRLPLFAALGNHEFEYGSMDDPLEYYYLYFPYPMYKELNKKDVSTYYYSFDWRPAHFVSFDSYSAITPESVRAAEGSTRKDSSSAQYKWLEKDLASTDRRWKIVFMHVPFRSTDDCSAIDSDGRKYFQPLFERYGVNLVLTGHIHNYQRTIVDGTPYMIIAGGGATLGAPKCGDSTDHKCRICDKNCHECSRNNPCLDSVCRDFVAHERYHFAYFTINGDEMNCKVIDENSSTIDDFSIKLRSPSSR